MTKDDISRIHHLKEYLDGWDWNMEPWFVIPEKDAKVLSKVIEMYESTLAYKRMEARRRKQKNMSGGIRNEDKRNDY